MRNPPAPIRAGYLGPETDQVELVFAEFAHADLGDSIRVVSDVKDYVWGERTWIGMPFQVRWITDGEASPRGEIAVQNVDRRIGAAVLGLGSPPDVTLTVLSSEDFDLTADPRTEIGTASIVIQARYLRLRNVRGNAATLTGDLVSFDPTVEPFPSLRATADVAPGLYWS